jgi:hypothetical protein
VGSAASVGGSRRWWRDAGGGARRRGGMGERMGPPQFSPICYFQEQIELRGQNICIANACVNRDKCVSRECL